jgi:hypothetical protein
LYVIAIAMAAATEIQCRCICHYDMDTAILTDCNCCQYHNEMYNDGHCYICRVLITDAELSKLGLCEECYEAHTVL